MFALVLCVALACVLDSVFISASAKRANHCEPIDVPLCKSLPASSRYHTTAEANAAARDRMANLSSIALKNVDDINCSSELVFVLCSYHLPICQSDVIVKPCRGFCQRVQRSCAKQIAALNATSLLGMNCDELPEFKTDACINSRNMSDNSTSTTTPQPTTDAKPTIRSAPLKLNKCHRKNETDRHPFLAGAMCNRDGSFVGKQCLKPPFGCYCVDSNGDKVKGTHKFNSKHISCPACTCAKNRSKLDRLSYKEGQYHFAIKASIISLKTSNKIGSDGNVTIISVNVSKVWRRGMVAIREGVKAILRYNATCLCPTLELHKEYIICGYEDVTQRTLLVTQDGTLEDSNDKFTTRIAHWENKIRDFTRKKMRRHSKKRRLSKKRRSQ